MLEDHNLQMSAISLPRVQNLELARHQMTFSPRQVYRDQLTRFPALKTPSKSTFMTRIGEFTTARHGIWNPLLGKKIFIFIVNILLLRSHLRVCNSLYYVPITPSFRLLSWAGKSIEPYGVDYILQKLGFSHARTTIPKWLQRGSLDPLDKLLALILLRLVAIIPHKQN